MSDEDNVQVDAREVQVEADESAVVEVAERRAGPETEETVVVVTAGRRVHWGEFIKFVMLILILLGTVFVVAATRPLVFDQVIPAVMGWDGTAGEGGSVDNETDGAPPDNGGAPAGPDEPETGTGGQPTATPNITLTLTVTPAVPEVITHTVEQGETLTRIADAYGVTVQAIVEANDIPDPDRIQPGTVLIIPPEE